MWAQMANSEALVERLERVERDLLRWKRLAGATLAGVGLVTLIGATTAKVPNEVRARAFVLVGENGKERGRLEARSDGSSGLRLLEDKAKTVVELGTGGGAYLSLDSEKAGFSVIASDRMKDVLLRLWAKDRKDFVELGAGAHGDTRIALGTEELYASLRPFALTMVVMPSKSSFAFRRAEYGASSLEFHDESPRVRARLGLGLSPSASPSLELFDAGQKTRAVLGSTELETVKTGATTRLPESSLVLFDKDGKVIWQAQ